MGTAAFPMRKRVIFRDVKESKGLRRGVLLYAAQENPQVDAEIAEERRFRTGTSLVIWPSAGTDSWYR